jgi:hypothetical protein
MASGSSGRRRTDKREEHSPGLLRALLISSCVRRRRRVVAGAGAQPVAQRVVAADHLFWDDSPSVLDLPCAASLRYVPLVTDTRNFLPLPRGSNAISLSLA